MHTPERAPSVIEVTIGRAGDGLRVTACRDDVVAWNPHLASVTGAELEAFARAVRLAAARGQPIGAAWAEGVVLQRELFGERLRYLVGTAPGRPVILRLRLADPELHRIPWEALPWGPDGEASSGFLGASRDHALVRVADAETPDLADPAAAVEAGLDLPARLALALANSGGEPRAVDAALFTPPTYVRLDERGHVVAPAARGLRDVNHERHPGERGSWLLPDPPDGRSLLVEPGAARSIASPSTDLEAARGALYPRVTSAPPGAIEPEQVVTFTLRLTPLGGGGLAPVGVDFLEGAATTALRAVVSSSAFARPEGEPWEQTFTVDRGLATAPVEWAFRARALGDRPAYALTIVFDVGGTPAGAYELRLRRRGAPEIAGAGGLVRIPAARSGAALVLAITVEGQGYRLRARRGAETVADAPWPMGTDPFFSELESAVGLAAIRELGYALYVSLPAEVTAAIDDPALDGLPILITSSVPAAPFEILRVRPDQNGPLLGVDRPVLRWTDKPPLPDADALRITGAACIRPEYPPPDDLPSAAEEERDLASFGLRYAGLAVERVALLAELDALMEKSSVQLLHFAGHAGGSPARLSLQDATVRPGHFDPGTPLMRARPFLFLNGCQAAVGRPLVPEFQADMVKMLLVARCTGALAPLNRVQSAAALAAERTFYAAAAAGQTVGEAAQAVRRLAFAPGTEGKSVGSYLSYLAFASPQLRLAFGAG
jgi:hypothetical protein